MIKILDRVTASLKGQWQCSKGGGINNKTKKLKIKIIK
jgi:hypothetical protein